MSKDMEILVKAKALGQYMIDNEWRYSNSGVSSTWAGSKKKKKSNCALFVSHVLQETGILKDGMTFYSSSNGKLIADDSVKKKLSTKFSTKYVKGKYAANLHGVLKPGDICRCNHHTMVFAGFNENEKPVWYDAGKKSTYTGAAGSRYKKIHRVGKNQKIYYVMRVK